MRFQTAAYRLVEALRELGVEVAFGLPGVHNLPLWRALHDCHTIRLVGVRHEQAAVYAADGYARATGKLGVALVTTGPGAANTLGATGEAMASGSPVLVVATDIPTTLRRPGVYRGVLHETRDQAAMFAPVSKGTRVAADAAEVATAVLAGGRAALAAPAGPVYVGVPTDLLRAEAPELPRGDPTGAVGGPAAEAALERAAALLADAQRPVVWAGGGARDAGPQVAEVARRLAAPVLTTYQGRGVVAPDHPCAVPGPVHTPEVGALWDAADVVLAVGSDFDGMMTMNWAMPAPPTLIAINMSATDADKNYPADVVLAGDAAAMLDALLPRLAQRPGLDALAARLEDVGARVRAAVEADEPQAAAFLDIMERALPDDAVVVADMCIPGYWLGGFYRVPAPRRLAYPVGWGTLGFAFPASLGAALAGAGPAVCVTGDGGFLFACGELATVAEHRLPLTVVLVDDGGYGMLRFDQEQAGETRFGVDLVTPDFAALAASFALPATTVDGFGPAFEEALAAAVAQDAPRVIVVRAALRPPPTTSPRWYRTRPEVP